MTILNPAEEPSDGLVKFGKVCYICIKLILPLFIWDPYGLFNKIFVFPTSISLFDFIWIHIRLYTPP